VAVPSVTRNLPFARESDGCCRTSIDNFISPREPSVAGGIRPAIDRFLGPDATGRLGM
jgi:hypothetical protein